MSLYRRFTSWVGDKAQQFAGWVGRTWSRGSGALAHWADKGRAESKRSKEQAHKVGTSTRTRMGYRLKSVGWQLVGLSASAVNTVMGAVAWSVLTVLGTAAAAVALVLALLLMTHDVVGRVVNPLYDVWTWLADVLTMGITLPVIGGALLVHKFKEWRQTRQQPMEVQKIRRTALRHNKPTFKDMMRRTNKVIAAPLAFIMLPVLFLFVGPTATKAEAKGMWHRYEERREIRSMLAEADADLKAREAAEPDKVHVETHIVMDEQLTKTDEEGPDFDLQVSEDGHGNWEAMVMAPEANYVWSLPEEPPQDYDPTPTLEMERLKLGRHPKTGEPLEGERYERYKQALDAAEAEGVSEAQIRGWLDAPNKKQRSYFRGRGYARSKYVEIGTALLESKERYWSLYHNQIKNDRRTNPTEVKRGFYDEIELIKATLAVSH